MIETQMWKMHQIPNLSSHKPETPTIDDKKEDVENVVKGKGSQPQTDNRNANEKMHQKLILI